MFLPCYPSVPPSAHRLLRRCFFCAWWNRPSLNPFAHFCFTRIFCPRYKDSLCSCNARARIGFTPCLSKQSAMLFYQSGAPCFRHSPRWQIPVLYARRGACVALHKQVKLHLFLLHSRTLVPRYSVASLLTVPPTKKPNLSTGQIRLF